ncbi:TPA: hypothetical protein ACGO35_000446 [Streptococcus suis]
MDGVDRLFAMQSWSVANDCIIRMSDKVRLILQEEKARAYAEIEEFETKVEQLKSDKERLHKVAVGLAEKILEFEWDMTRSSAMSQKANRRKWGSK